ncbi:alpha/beta hydrolase [Brevundimonas sp.]|uniref:alpha/beta fold hydrolase n=1 Tax=Brevundimonas sp. TaxID=1871086 RepID=UPI0028A1DFF0|nr:alpha/beta hydrolase [Brevundimonas sp.]
MKPVRSVRQFALRFAIVFALSVAAAGVVTPVFAAQATPAAPFASDRLSVEVRGQGPDVIFVPGYTSSREVWNETAERLAATHRVHLVQFSGFAGQAWSHGDGPFLAPALDELARYAGTLDKPALIGHSMGGFAGLRLAQQHPDLLSKVMSVDSLPFFGALMGPQATPENLVPIANQTKAMLLAVSPEMFRAQQAQTAVGMTLTEAKRTAIIEDSMKSDPQARATAIAELMVADARADLGKVSVPFWAVYAVDHSGGQGALATAMWTREYAALPDVKLEAVENSRHFIMYDQPERLNALIDAFLASD